MTSIKKQSWSIQLVVYSFLYTLLKLGLDKLIVNYFLMFIYIFNCFYCRSSQTLNGLYSQTSISIPNHGTFCFALLFLSRFVLLFDYLVADFSPLFRHWKDRYCPCISFRYCISRRSSYCLTSNHVGQGSAWYCWRTSTENRTITRGWTSMIFN